jgi:hypothetical protein
MRGEYGELTPEVKKKILGLNAARLYDIPVPPELDVADAHAGSGEPVASGPKAPA